MIEKNDITPEELTYIAAYTIQKIKNYPARLGKTVENYFDVLYISEIQNYLARREINKTLVERVAV